MFYQDPGHGWVRVPLKRLQQLGIGGRISGWSYVKGRYAYLEEDCDAGIFETEFKAQVGPLELVERHTNKESAIRDYARFDPRCLGGSA